MAYQGNSSAHKLHLWLLSRSQVQFMTDLRSFLTSATAVAGVVTAQSILAQPRGSKPHTRRQYVDLALAEREVHRPPFADWYSISPATPQEASSSEHMVARCPVTVGTRSYHGLGRSCAPDSMSIIYIQFTSLAALPVRFVLESAPFHCCPSSAS